MSYQNARSFLINLLRYLGRLLSTIGTPPLFALKILLWTILWTGQTIISILNNLGYIVISTGETFTWFLKILSSSGLKLYSLIKSHFKNLPFKISRSPLFSLSLGYRLKLFLPYLRLKLHQIKQYLSSNFNAYTFALKTSFQNTLRSRKLLPPISPLPSAFPSLSPKSLSFLIKIRYFLYGSLFFLLFVFIPFWTYSFLHDLPNPHLLAYRDIPVSTKIYDRNGILLYQIYADQNRTLISLTKLPPSLVQATIAIEDHNFYHHFGIDPQGIIRAAFANSQGEIVQGGSTITQQLIKSALLTSDRTLDRKIKEILLAFWAERLYSKDQILEMYFNQIPYGGAAYGINSASQTYFHKSPEDLSLAQSAFLAGLTSAPSAFSPFGPHPELSRIRQHQVLDSMVAQGFITPDQEDSALAEPLVFAPLQTEIKAPHFVMYVKNYLVERYGIQRVEQGGLNVTTSLDYPTYEKVTALLHDGVKKQSYLNVGNGAALVTDPQTGEILAMAGSIDFFDQQHDGNVNVTLAQRSPGSSIKPLNYALALERGLITPSTIIDDSPITYKTPGTASYSPQNYDNRFHGKVTARVALASSYNIPAVKVLDRNGLVNFLDFAQKMGISTWTDPDRYGLALTLGGGEVTMLDLATAYSPFATGGNRVNLKSVLKVTDYRNNVLEDNTQSNSTRVLSPKTAFLISSILSDDSARAPTFGRGSALNIPGKTVAVKTGTTETKRDNWTIGYTPHLLVAVWVGNNDNTPMSPLLESGNTGATAIWNPIMQTLLSDQPNEPLTPPANVIPVQICALNGLLSCENCPFTVTEYFESGSQPKVACNFSKEDVDKILHPDEDKPKP